MLAVEAEEGKAPQLQEQVGQVVEALAEMANREPMELTTLVAVAVEQVEETTTVEMAEMVL